MMIRWRKKERIEEITIPPEKKDEILKKLSKVILKSNLCDYSDAYIVVKGRISVASNNVDNRRNKKLTFKNNAPLDHVFQKSITHLLTMQKILILLCQCIIC